MLRYIEKHFWVVLLAGVIAGLTLPSIGNVSTLVPYLKYAVMIMLFTVFLKLNVADMLRGLKDTKLMAYVLVSYLVIIPIGAYFLFRPFGPEIATGVLILCAIPPGTAAPTLTDLIKGNTALAATITIATSLIAPFTVPLVMSIGTGTDVTLDRSELFVSLATTMFVPLILAQLIRTYAKPVAAFIRPRGSTINVFVLFFMIYLVIASQRERILESPLETFWLELMVIAVYIALHVIGYYLAPWLKTKDRLALATTKAYQNLGLAIVVAAHFSPKVLLIVVLGELPWALMPGPFRAIAQKL